MLLMTTALLYLEDELGAPVFSPKLEAGAPGEAHSLLLDPGVFEELGRPEVITVTIQPGDLLNAETTDNFTDANGVVYRDGEPVSEAAGQ